MRRESHRDDEWAEDLATSFTGLLPVVGPLVSPLAKRLAREAAKEQRRNRSKALRAAERMSGLDRLELGERIAAHPELVPLLARVLHAAAMTGSDDILIALGAALGMGAREPRRVDEAEFLLLLISELNSQHVRVLRSLDPSRLGQRPGLASEELYAAAEMRRDLAIAAVTVLQLRELVNNTSLGHTETIWMLTDLGKDVLELLDAVAD